MVESVRMHHRVAELVTSWHLRVFTGSISFEMSMTSRNASRRVPRLLGG